VDTLRFSLFLGVEFSHEMIITVHGRKKPRSTGGSTPPPPDTTPAAINASPSPVVLSVAATQQATATVVNAAGAPLAVAVSGWHSSDTAVATVNGAGLITAVGPGTANITALLTSPALTSNPLAITVTVPVDNTPNTITVTTPSPVTVEIGATQQLTAVVRNAAGQILALAVTWLTSTPPVATVSLSGLVSGVSQGTATVTASIGGVTSNAVTVTVPSAAPPVSPDMAEVLALLGPTVPVADMPSRLSWYQERFATNEALQWAAFGNTFAPDESIALYERPAMYYAMWARTGNADYLARGHALAVSYRDNYLVPSGFSPSPHFSQMESLYLHWRLTGDAASRDAILAVCTVFVAAFVPHLVDHTSDWIDNRIQARTLVALWMAEKVVGAGNTYTSGSTVINPGAILDSEVAAILADQKPEGFWGYFSTCEGSWNYMEGMLSDVLSRLHDKRPAAYNAGIRTALESLGNYLWSVQWRGNTNPVESSVDGSFNYAGIECMSAGGPTSAPDLNGFFIPLFGWLGKTTGVIAWIQKGDAILTGMLGGIVDHYRHLSETYHSSYRYFGYRAALDPATLVRIELNTASPQTLAPGVTLPISATPKALNESTTSHTVVWTTTDAAVASIVQTGNNVVVTGVATGTATIQCHVGSLVSKAITVNVFVPQLVDDLTSLANFSTIVDGSNTATIVSGEAVLSTAPSNGTASIRTSSNYQLTARGVLAEISQVGPTGQTSVSVIDASGNGYKIEYAAVLSFYRIAAGVATAFGPSVSYDATAHRWLGIRDNGTDVEMVASPDGNAITVLTTASYGAENRAAMKATLAMVDAYFGATAKFATLIVN
jgi:hypothetical protein